MLEGETYRQSVWYQIYWYCWECGLDSSERSSNNQLSVKFKIYLKDKIWLYFDPNTIGVKNENSTKNQKEVTMQVEKKWIL